MSARFTSLPGYMHLEGGPGHGHTFYVQRAPVYVRVVRDINGKWNVLDLYEDTPTKEEELFVYRQVEWVHVRASKQSGMHYTYEPVPIDGSLKATLRYRTRWVQWAELQAKEYTNPKE
jgi:hypothetical protein